MPNKRLEKKINMADLVKKEESKTNLAKNLGISRSSLYYKSILKEKDKIFKEEIIQVMTNNKAYGHKRIAYALGRNKKKVLRVMKKFGLKPQRMRSKKPSKKDDLNQEPTSIPNLIKDLEIERINQVWATDFTYLIYFGRFIYLATIIDIFTRRIVGWEVSVRHDVELVKGALINALANNPAPDIIHSDQGSEYRSNDFLNLVKSSSIDISMSKKSSPWENGYKESFYSEFKLELGHPQCHPNLGELVEAISQQIHYYNYERIHTALRCPPMIFEQKLKVEKTKILN